MNNQTEGLRLACLYSCGCPEIRGYDEDIIRDFVRDPREYMVIPVRSILNRIEPYLFYQLIARLNGISDPFDPDVVKAYWLGGGLLEQITKEVIDAISFDGFPALARRRLEELEKRAAFPHHNTSVLQTLFTPDMPAEKMPRERLESANSCLVTAGWVASVDNCSLEVRAPIVVAVEGRFAVQWGVASIRKGFVGKIAKREWVSIHLGSVRETISDRRAQETNETIERALACFI